MSNNSKVSHSVKNIFKKYGADETDIRNALSYIRLHIHYTPVLTSNSMNRWLNKDANDAEKDNLQTKYFFKAENLQRTGSFKIRGALNALSNISKHFESESESNNRPIITHSSGNHGQAIALASRVFKRDAYIVVPLNAPVTKLSAMISYGAHIEFCPPSMKSRTETAERLVEEKNGIMIHPFDDFRVVCGQGTIALELFEQVPDLDAIVVAIGGGGLISGISLMALSINPNIRIIGAESIMCNSACKSLAMGERVQTPYDVSTVADAIKASVGNIGWAAIQDLVHDVISVSEEDIKNATKMVFERMKIVIEGSAGAAVAAVRTEKFKSLGCRKAVVILCGGNVDANKLPWM